MLRFYTRDGSPVPATHRSAALRLACVRSATGNEVLDPGVVLVVFGLGAVGQHGRSAYEP